MIDARFRIELPDHCWIDDVSRSHPEATYRLLASVRTAEDRAVELGEVVAENGWYEFDLTGSREAFDRFRATLEEFETRYELLSIVERRDPEQLLTDRQRETLDAALRQGYFEVPRECTLSELAAELDVDTSAASRTLRRGAAQVLRWYLTSANPAAEWRP